MWNKYSFLPAVKHESLLQIDGITLGVILCTPPPLSAGWIEPPTKFSKGWGALAFSGWGGCNFHINKI